MPTVDSQKILAYLRYAEGLASDVEISIGEPKTSLYPGLYELPVRLKKADSLAVRTYYLTKDSRRLIFGSIFDLDSSPFVDNLALLREDADPAAGPADASVKVYVFSDLQCPYCAEMAKVYERTLIKQNRKDVRLVFKNFPLESIHHWARAAALIGHCVAQQDPTVFWAYQQWIFAHQKDINEKNIGTSVEEFVRSHSLDYPTLSSCKFSHGAEDQIDRDLDEGHALGVVETPTVFINGRMVSGAISDNQLVELIQMELGHNRPASATIAVKRH